MLTAPGDVWIQPGRNVNIIAADDCIIKVHRSVDITSTKNDVRIKAERNLQILAGNDQSEGGGVVIESRAPAAKYDFAKDGEDVKHSGILLIAPDSDIACWGKSVYLRTGEIICEIILYGVSQGRCRSRWRTGTH